MKPKERECSLSDPVRKPDLWRCFKRDLSGFATVQVSAAHAIIGRNAPRYLERQGYLVKDKTETGDFYSLTVLGEQWLIRGIRAYARNHPAEKENIAFFPEEVAAPRRVRRRV